MHTHLHTYMGFALITLQFYSLSASGFLGKWVRSNDVWYTVEHKQKVIVWIVFKAESGSKKQGVIREDEI